MAKKSHQRKSKHRTRPSEIVKERHIEQAKLITPKPLTPKVVSSKSQYTIADYSYVRRDLRLIGILAGSLIIVLIILSFILG